MNGFQIAMLVLGSLFIFGLGVLGFLKNFLRKAHPGRALVKTGFGMSEPQISLSSAFIIPLIHQVDDIDLTVKVMRITRKGPDSLSCADGIRAEVEVDFYIQINPKSEDIRRVSMSIGCQRASSQQTLQELFEAKFADALKTAGSKMRFDDLYQNRTLFRDEILKALGQSGDSELVLNGYKMDDVAIQYLEQLPLNKHDENNVLDSKGRFAIVSRTALESENANKRLREKEITILEQNQTAKTRELEINQDLSFKEAYQQRQIAENKAKEDSLREKTIAEQKQLEESARIEAEKQIALAKAEKENQVKQAQIELTREMRIKEEEQMKQIKAAEIIKEQENAVALQRKEKAIIQEQIEKEKATEIANQEREKALKLAEIDKEISAAEAERKKLKALEENEKQRVSLIAATNDAETLKAVGLAKMQKEIEIIDAQKNAQMNEINQNVMANVEAFKIQKIAEAELESAKLAFESSQLRSKAVIELGKAEAEKLKLMIEAQNSTNFNNILAQNLEKLIPLLPEIVERMMKPVEKIDSIKVMNINGMPENSTDNSSQSPVFQTIMNAGLLFPVIKEIISYVKNDEDLSSRFNLQEMKSLIDHTEKKS